MTKEKQFYYGQEVANMFGLHKLTIRNYVKRGLLPERRNPANNYRIFTPEDIKTLEKLLKVVVVKPKLRSAKRPVKRIKKA